MGGDPMGFMTKYWPMKGHTSDGAISLYDAWQKVLADFWENFIYWNIIIF